MSWRKYIYICPGSSSQSLNAECFVLLQHRRIRGKICQWFGCKMMFEVLVVEKDWWFLSSQMCWGNLSAMHAFRGLSWTRIPAQSSCLVSSELKPACTCNSFFVCAFQIVNISMFDSRSFTSEVSWEWTWMEARPVELSRRNGRMLTEFLSLLFHVIAAILSFLPGTAKCRVSSLKSVVSREQHDHFEIQLLCFIWPDGTSSFRFRTKPIVTQFFKQKKNKILS